MLKRFVALAAVALLFGLPAFSLAQKPQKGNQNQKNQTAPTDSDNLPPGKYQGTLKTLPASDGTFSLDVAYTHWVPKQGQGNLQQKYRNNNQMMNLVRQQQQLAQAQQRIATARTPQQAAQAMQHLNQVMMNFQRAMMQAQLNPQNNPFQLKTDHKTIDFELADNVVVRTMILPEVFDEKGNIKQYTEEEKKALKGKNPNLPGYEAKIDDIKQGQTVTVTLSHVTPKKPAAKEGDKDADKDTTTHKKNRVTMIVIEKDSTTNTNPGPGGKKKNN